MRHIGKTRIAILVSASVLAITVAPVMAVQILGTDGPDVLEGTPNADDIHGFHGNDVIYGRGGNDEIDGGFEDDTLFGGYGDEVVIYGNTGNDLIYGGPGTDRIYGNKGDNELHGGKGPDRIIARATGSEDFVFGGWANDIIKVQGDGSTDVVDCGSGIDKVYYGPLDQIAANCEKRILVVP
jgi:hypothetical protein